MADVFVNGQGLLFDVPTETSTNFSTKSDSGYFRGNSSQSEWTGTNLTYASGSTGTTNVFPTGGTLTSLTVKNAAGIIQVQVTNMSYTIPAGDAALSESQKLAKALAGNDMWSGSAGNETFFYGLGNDNFNGNGGLDTLKFIDTSTNFSIANIGSGYTLSFVTPGTSLTGQLSTLTNIERLQFPDKMIALDIGGNAGQAYRLYQAAFDRKPDLAGLGYWINALDKGANLVDAARGFMNSPEFMNLYGSNPSNEDLVTHFYGNVLHRQPDQDGYAWWVNELSTGHQSPQVALTGFSESPENQAQVIGSIKNGIEFIPAA